MALIKDLWSKWKLEKTERCFIPLSFFKAKEFCWEFRVIEFKKELCYSKLQEALYYSSTGDNCFCCNKLQRR